MKIVTGKTGTPHVTSQEFRQFVEGTVGQESYILASGENLEPELSSNNLLKIRSGMMCHHGNISCVELSTYDEVTIQNGNQGMKRIDLVVNRHSKNDETGIESNDWVVLMGTPDAEAPVAPAYTEGNLQEGDLVDDCPVFEVHLDGINVTEVEKLLSVTPDMSTLNAYLSDLISKSIVESDSNDNGHYRKYADGTLEMWGRFSISRTSIDNPSGTNYVSDSYTFPLPYTSLTSVRGVSLSFASRGGYWITQSTGGDMKSTVGYWLVSGSSQSNAEGILSFRCTGTWK